MKAPLCCGALAVLLLCISCTVTRTNFNFVSPSPNGRYTLKLKGRGEPPYTAFWESQRQVVSLETMRDDQVVASDANFFSEDSLDVYFLDRYPTSEWLNSSTLRLGDWSSNDPFQDRLVVTNRTDKLFDVVILEYGKYEMFFIYDLAPGAQVELKGSPQLHRETVAWNVYYRAFINGVPLTGNVNGPERTKDSARAINLAVDIVVQKQ